MEFIKYSQEYDVAIQQYILTDDQLMYTASPKYAIDHLDEERHAILVFQDDLFISFFVLQEGKGAIEFKGEEDSILLRSFSTDNRYVGRGFGNKVMSILPSYIKENFPSIQSIVLAVNEQNDLAKRLYIKNGFLDNGKRKQGEKGLLIILELLLY